MRRALLLTIVLATLAVGARPLRADTARTVTVAIAHEPDRFYKSATLTGQLVANLVFDPLVGLDDQMNPYPVLAATIPTPSNSLVRLSGDGADRRLIVTMPLRSDVSWSDGEPFTADDVIFTWQVMMNPQSGFDSNVEDKLKSVERIDDHTVAFRYLSANEAKALDPERYKAQGTEPVVDPLYMFGLYDAPAIYPRHKLRAIVGDDPRHSRQIGTIETSEFARNPVGTGPFVLSSWDRGNTLLFNSREISLPHRPGRPALDTILFRVIADKNDSLTALAQDQVQLVAQDSLDAGDAPVLDGLPGIQARYTPGNAWEHLTLNLDNPILADADVRQAIAYGLNRDGLNEAIMFGKAQVATSQVPVWSWAFDPNLPQYESNLAEANRLLDRAGWARSAADGIRVKNGQRLSLKYWSTPASFRPGLMALVRDQLAQIGIDLSIDSFSVATLFDTTSASPQALVGRQFDIVEFAWVSSYDPGTDAVYSMHSSNIPSQANGFQGGNYGDYRNPRSDQLLNQLQSSLDPSFRRTAMLDLQAIWQSDLPVIPLLLRPITTASSPRLLNFRPTPAPAGETWNVEQWALAGP